MKWKIAVGIVCIIGLIWIIRYTLAPAPGKKTEDQGRDHVTADKVAAYSYNSNPPTSGPHLETWVKPGVYTTPQSEGELIHSLEHGYVIISYSCLNPKSQIPNSKQITNPKSQIPKFLVSKVYADHPEDTGLAEEATPSADVSNNEASKSATINTESCKLLASELEALVRRKKLFKLILVPRPNLDVPIALTSWTYIDKLDSFDTKRIEQFIDYHRDHGPEKTME